MIDSKARGMTMVETLTVVVLITLVLAPILDVFLSSRRNAAKGFEKLETLDRARFILEKVQRDLKSLCSGPGYGFMPVASTTMSFSFPVFPAGPCPNLADGSIPVHGVTYRFDPQQRTLVRILAYHPQSSDGPKGKVVETLGRNVLSFSILPKEMLGVRYYDVEVICQSKSEKKDEPVVFLRTAVRSEFESRLQRHSFFLPNRDTAIGFPP